jgi:hypothetical protein
VFHCRHPAASVVGAVSWVAARRSFGFGSSQTQARSEKQAQRHRRRQSRRGASTALGYRGGASCFGYGWCICTHVLTRHAQTLRHSDTLLLAHATCRQGQQHEPTCTCCCWFVYLAVGAAERAVRIHFGCNLPPFPSTPNALVRRRCSLLMDTQCTGAKALFVVDGHSMHWREGAVRC